MACKKGKKKKSKLFLLLISILLLFCSPIYAKEAVQDVSIDSNKAVVHVQKQPMNSNSSQKADIKKNWFCIIIQVNGKAPFDKTDN